MVKLIINRY